MSSTPVVPPRATVQSVNCPGCGSTLTLRSFGRAVSLVCPSCHSVLDARDPRLKIIQTFKAAANETLPKIPLASRGKWQGIQYEVIGFQRRTIHVEGVDYSWHEYLLFNPYRGFRYLTEYNGHWNDVLPLTMLPDASSGSHAYCMGKTYRHFQTANAKTTFVLGEFPWRVKVGETNQVSDYIAPPYVISSEKSEGETTWSQGEYVQGADLWKAFGLKSEPPRPIGIYANQPSPMRATAGMIWKTLFVFCTMLLVLLIANAILSEDAKVFEGAYTFRAVDGQEQSFVTPTFYVGGRISDVQIDTTAGLSNSWIYVNYALINQDTGEAYDVGRELSYYYGSDEDGPWSEGSNRDSVVIPTVPPGNYYLRIEPESNSSVGAIAYTVRVVRDVPVYSIYLVAFGALLLPALLILWRTFSFEQQRWAESDHPMGSLMAQAGLSNEDDDE